MALKTMGGEVKKDEEFFVSYGYHLGVNLPWYQDAYKEFAKKNPDKVNAEFLKTLTSKGEEGIGAGEAPKEEGEEAKEESVVVENDGTV